MLKRKNQYLFNGCMRLTTKRQRNYKLDLWENNRNTDQKKKI